MKISDFELYRDLLQRHSGLSLTAEKSYLLDSRLTPVARKWGYPTLDAMTLALRGMPERKLVEDVIEAMMNQDTGFFRDMKPFFFLRDVVIPHFIKSRGRDRRLRIWSAGCSTGQEAFSIAMTIKDLETVLKNWRIEILGTDISNTALARAATGHFSQFDVQRGLPVKDLIRHFDETDDGWVLRPDVRGLVHFEPLNILDSMDDLGLFDVIFCRNVLTYFDGAKRGDILSRLADQMVDDGFLFLGADETLNGLDTPFQMIDPECSVAGLIGVHYNLETLKKSVSS